MKTKKGIIRFQYKLLLLFIVVFIIPMTVYGVIVTRNLTATYLTSAHSANRDAMASTENNLNSMWGELQRFVFSLSTDTVFVDAISKSDEDFDKDIDYIQSNERIFTKLSNQLALNSMVKSVYLYTPSGEMHYVNYQDPVDNTVYPSAEKWYQRAMVNRESFFLAPHADQQSLNKTKIICSYVAPVEIRGENSKDAAAVIVINFLPDEFYKRLIVSDEKHTVAALITGEGSLITKKGYAGTDSGMIISAYRDSQNGTFVLNGDQYISDRGTLSNIGCEIAYITNKSILVKPVQGYNNSIILFTTALSIIFLLIAMLLSGIISRPVKGIQEISEAIKHGNPTKKYTMPRIKTNFLIKDEYDELTDSINNLINIIEESSEVQKKQEFDILQMQINPHFIYNTLNTIKWNAKIEGNQRTEEAVTALINLFKSTLKVGNTYISIGEEISQIKDYINVQSYRYDDNFNVKIIATNGVEKYRTLKFLLQPIVENAIFHGLDLNDPDALLTIDIRIDGVDILYHIKDNGVGMSEEQVERILTTEKKQTGMTGIGLYNVNSRIKQYFGEQYGLKISSTPGKGTSVTMRIPACTYVGEKDEDTYR